MQNNDKLEPGLYLVPTPLGNLEDITLRALRILRNVDIIACEDTRHTGNLLKLLDIHAKQVISYHDHNEAQKADYLISMILEGKSLALVSDAGSPAISDPGYRLVDSAIKSGVKIVPLPGPTAFVPALIASGLPVHKFTFVGFPPQKKGRKTFMEEVMALESTIIMYESPYRIEKLVQEIAEYGGKDRKVCVAREISKIYEEFIRASAQELIELFKSKTNLKGEFVVLVEGLDKRK